MAIVTERIPILVTAREKARIAREAERPRPRACRWPNTCAALQAVAASEDRLAKLDSRHSAPPPARKRRTAGA